MAKDTDFLPAARDPKEQIQAQVRGNMSTLQLLKRLLGVVPEILMVLNAKRQIVFVNEHLLRFVECRSPQDVYAARPGEIMKCVHAAERDGGCGTTKACRQCGMSLAILSAQKGKQGVEECRITRDRHGEAINLRVRSTPLEANGQRYTVLSALDVSDEKRREALERVLFEDIGVVADSIRDRADDLKAAPPQDAMRLSGEILRLADLLEEGVNEHRLLAAAENDELYIRPAPFSTMGLLGEIVEHFKAQPLSAEKELVFSDDTRDAEMVSDRTLLKQLLFHMVRNALEACESRETVTVHTSARDDRVEFRVHNPNCMPEDVQLRIFQRAFSTKGKGRGLGTYTMKLFSEKYLAGRVKCTSTQRVGTVFLATYPLDLTAI
jgi:signal transduction histidine kinase